MVVFIKICRSFLLYNKTNIVIGLIEYDMNSLLGSLHIVDYTYCTVISYLIRAQKIFIN